MPRRKTMDVEKEIAKALETGKIRPYYEALHEMVIACAQHIDSFEQGADMPGRKLRVKLAKIISYSVGFRLIIQSMRGQRKRMRKIGLSNDKKSSTN